MEMLHPKIHTRRGSVNRARKTHAKIDKQGNHGSFYKCRVGNGNYDIISSSADTWDILHISLSRLLPPHSSLLMPASPHGFPVSVPGRNQRPLLCVPDTVAIPVCRSWLCILAVWDRWSCFFFFLRPLPLLCCFPLLRPVPFCTASNCCVVLLCWWFWWLGCGGGRRLCAADEDVVQGNVDCGRRVSFFRVFRRKVQLNPGCWLERHTELDEVPDGAHDEETDANGLGDLDEFRAVG